LCPNCAQLQCTLVHSSALQRTTPWAACLSTTNSYAYLHAHGPRSENPGVGGSIPSQATIVFSPASKDLARAARARRVPSTRLTRTVLGLTRFVRVVVASGMTGVAGVWVS
jgi:hypothetical protein